MTATTCASATDKDFEAIASVAEAALREARRHGIPPDPRAFEVFYGYVSNSNERLRESVEAVLRSDLSPSANAIERIYEEHLALNSAPNRYMQIGERLDAEMSDITELLTTKEVTDAEYLGSLNRARDGMSLFGRPGAMKKVLRDLIDLSREHAEETAAFVEELSASRRQVEELSRELKTLRESAYLDHLTDVPNRRRLDVVLETEIAAAGERGPLCFALADIDNFKALNDRFGHAVGDSVLQLFAGILKRNLKGKDTPARFGGEEFAMVLPATKLLGARHICEKIRQELAASAFVVSDTREPIGSVTVSIGVTEHHPGGTAAELLDRADKLLYEAKASGRNRVVSGP